MCQRFGIHIYLFITNNHNNQIYGSVILYPVERKQLPANSEIRNCSPKTRGREMANRVHKKQEEDGNSRTAENQQRKSSIFKYYNLCVCLAIVVFVVVVGVNVSSSPFFFCLFFGSRLPCFFFFLHDPHYSHSHSHSQFPSLSVLSRPTLFSRLSKFLFCPLTYFGFYASASATVAVAVAGSATSAGSAAFTCGCVGAKNKNPQLLFSFAAGIMYVYVSQCVCCSLFSFFCMGVYAFWKFSLKFKVSRITHTTRRQKQAGRQAAQTHTHTNTRFSLFTHSHMVIIAVKIIVFFGGVSFKVFFWELQEIFRCN